MGRILHILVTCSRDESRDDIACKVIDSLAGVPRSDLLCFDNCSTHNKTLNRLTGFADFICIASRNFGFWSALKWCLDSHESVLGKAYDYVYVIESDMVHYCYPDISLAEAFLDTRPDIGCVRLQEFSVQNAHLYDKNRPCPESRRYAWTRLSNHFTGETAYFRDPLHRVYVTNLAPQLGALNRMSFMKEAFDALAKRGHIAETNFQEEYFKRYRETGVLDGGIFNAAEAFIQDAISGSFSAPERQASAGYRPTRVDAIEPIRLGDVTKVNTTTRHVMV